MRMLIVAAAALAIVGSPALAQQKAQQKPSAASVAFAKKVAGANAFEIQSSELARDRAQSNEVKSFAKQMITEHTKLGEEFKSVTEAANIPPPPASVQPSAKAKAELSKLRRAKGPAFDRAYLAAQLSGHKEAASVLRKYAKTGRTAQLKEFAQKTLPTVEKHLSEVTDLRNQLVAAGRGPSGVGTRAIGPPAEKAPRQKSR